MWHTALRGNKTQRALASSRRFNDGKGGEGETVVVGSKGEREAQQGLDKWNNSLFHLKTRVVKSAHAISSMSSCWTAAVEHVWLRTELSCMTISPFFPFHSCFTIRIWYPHLMLFPNFFYAGSFPIAFNCQFLKAQPTTVTHHHTRFGLQISVVFMQVLWIPVLLVPIRWHCRCLIVSSSTLWNCWMGRRCPGPWLIPSRPPKLPKACCWAASKKQVSSSTWTLAPGTSPSTTTDATWSKCYSTALP